MYRTNELVIIECDTGQFHEILPSYCFNLICVNLMDTLHKDFCIHAPSPFAHPIVLAFSMVSRNLGKRKLSGPRHLDGDERAIIRVPTTCLHSLAIFRLFRKIAKSDYKLFHVCSSFCPHGTTRLPLDGLLWNLIFESVSKIYREDSVSLKYDKNSGNLTLRPVYILIVSRSVILKEKCFRQSLWRRSKHPLYVE